MMRKIIIKFFLRLLGNFGKEVNNLTKEIINFLDKEDEE